MASTEHLKALLRSHLEGVTETGACGYPDGSVVSAVSTGPARESVGRDAGMRPALRRYLDQRALAYYPETVLIEELGLCQGRARIDLATVGGVLHGYEIKSNGDRLSRLASQAETYSRVFDRVTLVVGGKHVRAALRLVPRWWGVLLARGGIEGVSLDPLRSAAENPDQDPRALVELLWRDEALELLACHNAAAGVRSKPRPAVWDRVCEALDLTQIRSAVRYRLRIRAGTSTYGVLPNRRSVILGSIAAELSTFREKAGATRIPRTLSAVTPLDSRSPRYDVSWV